MACTVQLQASPLHCPISAQIRSIRANHGQEFWYCLDYFIKHSVIYLILLVPKLWLSDYTEPLTVINQH